MVITSSGFLPRLGLIKVVALALVALGMGLGGCVKQDTYDSLYEANRALTAENTRLSEQIKSVQATNDALMGRLGAGDRTLAEANATNAALRAALDSANKRYADMEGRLGGIQFGPLDAATDAALQALAAANPGLLEYDAARGMLRFKSDVTFASGSTDLTDTAKSALAQLGRILLDTPSAKQYDIQVVGHTDSQRVSQRAGRPFRNNLELSAFRAISVHDALVNEGLPANKVQIAGWGEFRPLVENAASGNTPQNRRVEIYLVRSAAPSLDMPATPSAPASSGSAKPAAPAKKPAANPDIMK